MSFSSRVHGAQRPQPIVIDDYDSDELPPLKLVQKTPSRQNSSKSSQGSSADKTSQGSTSQRYFSQSSPIRGEASAPLSTLDTNEVGGSSHRPFRHGTKFEPKTSSRAQASSSTSHRPPKRERGEVIVLSSDEDDSSSSRPPPPAKRRIVIVKKHPNTRSQKMEVEEVISPTTAEVTETKGDASAQPVASGSQTTQHDVKPPRVEGAPISAERLDESPPVRGSEGADELEQVDGPKLETNLTPKERDQREEDAALTPGFTEAPSVAREPGTNMDLARSPRDSKSADLSASERPSAVAGPSGGTLSHMATADGAAVAPDFFEARRAAALFDSGPEMPGAFRSGPNQWMGGTTPVDVETDAGVPLPFPSIWAQAINGLSALTGTVTDEGATTADALGQIFQADEEAIADMANLKPCSAAALQQLKDAGLKTTLKNHQSSGLKFLVDSEHRQLPRPGEGDVCLWVAQRGARGNVFYVNRVSHDMDKSPRMPRGAILSDAMGLGKTLTVLALTLTPDDGKGIIDAPDAGKGKSSTACKNPKSSPKKEVKAKSRKKRLVMPTMGTPLDLDSDIEWSSSSGDESEDKEASQKKLPTLIVCPLSVVSNWVGQVKTHLDAKKFRIGVLHGAEGVKLLKEKNWSKYNLIVTTYDVLSSSYRHLALLKGHVRREVDFEMTEKAFRKSLDSYERYAMQERGQPALSAAKERSAQLLKNLKERHAKSRLICPTTSGKTDEKKTDICLARARKFQRNNSEEVSDEHYPVIEKEEDLLYCWSGKVRKPENERVFNEEWKRVVLDEAHVVRNPSTIAYHAVLALKAERRHAVTGTPLINKTNDIGSLAAWIGVSPYAGQPNQGMWTNTVENSIKKEQVSGIRILRSITKSLVCLRTKEMRIDGKALVELPPMKIHSMPLELKPDDRIFYDNAEMALRQRIVQMVEDGELDGNQSCILVFLARMRQLANDRRLVPADLIDRILKADMTDGQPAQPGSDESNSLTQAQIEMLQERLGSAVDMYEDCPICMEAFTRENDPVITWCKHIFHRACIEQSIASNPSCPLDRYPLVRSTKLISLPVEVEPQELLHSEGSIDGIKIDAIIEITRMVEASGDDKIIIFSNFTSLLKLVEKRLESENVPFVSFYGSHTKNQRDAALASFARPLPKSVNVARSASGGLAAAGPSSGSALLDWLDRVDLAVPAAGTSHNIGTSKSTSKAIPRVILMSIGAGSVGINLTAASHVILVDPWWQSAIEEQAFARAHRLGQTKPVNVYRLISARTVEERVISIAQEKAQLSSFALQGVTFKGKALWKASDSQQARLRDLGAMFGMNAEEMARISRANRLRR